VADDRAVNNWVGPLDEALTSDEQLAAAAAREGSDGLAFGTLLSRYRERVWRICYRLMGNPHDAQDAAQEVFVRLFTGRKAFAGRSKYATWVYGIALRTCLAQRRSRGRRQRRVHVVGDEILLQQPARNGGQATPCGLDLQQMLETLGEEDRALLILKYAEEYRYEELSEMFQLSVSACKMRVRRARERLRDRYPKEME